MKRILAVDGGGTYGIIPAQVLSMIESELGKPLREVFDLFAGTSTGGIIALGAGLGIPAARMVDLYAARSGEVFRRPRARWRRAFLAKYDDDGLKRVLKDELGPLNAMAHCKARDEKGGVMVAVRNVSSQSNTFFKSYKNPTLPAWGVGVATASAPTFLPEAELGGQYYVDGGLFAADPSYFALIEARKLWPGEQYLVLSLGTGQPPPKRFNPKDRGKGLVYWGQRIAGDFLDGQDDTMQHMLAHATDADVYRFQMDLAKSKHMDETDPVLLEQVRAQAETAARLWLRWDDLLHQLQDG